MTHVSENSSIAGDFIVSAELNRSGAVTLSDELSISRSFSDMNGQAYVVLFACFANLGVNRFIDSSRRFCGHPNM
jgi:hypothetical protein